MKRRLRKARRLRWSLLMNWDFACVICGEAFAAVNCVSKDHVVPRSLGGKSHDNLAPAHRRCNSLRSDGSLLKAAQAIDAVRQEMSPEEFQRWANVPCL